MKNKSISLLVLSSFASLLTACGGGGSPSNNTQVNNPTTNIQPAEVSTTNWQSARMIQVDNAMENSIEVIGSELVIDVQSGDLSGDKHLQIFINTDNIAETGFQFDNQAWNQSGIDYLIEDGDLFKSTANNSGWNWNIDVGTIDYSINGDRVTANVDLSLLGDMCNNIKVGVMVRDERWDILTFSPASAQMQEFTVSYCSTETADTVKPEISLLGANPINLTLGSELSDPGATATDNTDGDITANIISSPKVDNSAVGTYSIHYSVTDTAGNSTTISRVVNVIEDVSEEEMVVDGNTNDWDNIPTYASSADAIMKVTDDAEKIYILITADTLGDNIQVLMDTDNQSVTGLDLSAQIAQWTVGADYMIENNSLDKSIRRIGWSWDYGIAPIEFIKTADALEIAIKKSDFSQLANHLPMGFVSRTEDWNVNYILPNATLPVYNLLFPTGSEENNAPVAVDDTAASNHVTPVSVNVLANDTDSDGDSLTIVSVTNQEEYELTIDGANIIYDPASNNEDISFEYTITDGNGATSTANVTIDITNAAPVLTDDTATTSSDQVISIPVLLNDNDPEGNFFKIVRVTQPNSGSVSIDQNTFDQVIFDPEGQSDSVSFNYTVEDEWGAQSTAKVTVNVTVNTPQNTAPEANDNTVTTVGTNPLPIAVLENDTDADGDSLQITDFTQPSNGSLSLDASNATFIYTPNATFSGSDTFEYTISDGNGGSDTAAVFITVPVTVPPNNAPDAIDDTVTTVGTNPLPIAVLENDTDADGDTLEITGFTQPSNGSLSLDATNATFIYTPNATFSGSDTFEYTISDGNGGSDTADVNITVPVIVPPNNAPVANNNTVSTDGINTLTIVVLQNDTDADGDTLEITGFTQPSNGTLSLNAANGTFDYTPNATFSGRDTFEYTISDGNGGSDTAKVFIDVPVIVPPNNAPVANDNTVSTVGINTITIAVLENDTDADGDALEITGFTQPSNGTLSLNTANGTFDYTPNATFSGRDTFEYTISDGNGGSSTAEVTINVPANNAPDAVEDTAVLFNNATINVDVLENDTDPDGDILSIVPGSVEPLSEGIVARLNADGTIFVDPQGIVASLSVIYTVTDGRGGTDSAVLTLASTDPDDPNLSFPTVSNESVVTPKNTPIFIDVLANDFDSDGDTLSIDMVDDPANGTTEKVTRNGVAGILYTPDPDFVGTDSFFYGVPDGRGNNGSGKVDVLVTE